MKIKEETLLVAGGQKLGIYHPWAEQQSTAGLGSEAW
jgi:hypothetical protein